MIKCEPHLRERRRPIPRVKDPTQPYSHRRLDSTVINTTMDTEAVELLYRYGGTGRQNTGRFLARLLYEHHARMQERTRVKENLYAALDGGNSLVTEADVAFPAYCRHFSPVICRSTKRGMRTSDCFVWCFEL